MGTSSVQALTRVTDLSLHLTVFSTLKVHLELGTGPNGRGEKVGKTEGRGKHYFVEKTRKTLLGVPEALVLRMSSLLKTVWQEKISVI